ncbi:MAG: hypothetical protein FWB83_04330, partial [Treponema sp.]|nr:hypothetical protein [Treponema sp.]
MKNNIITFKNAVIALFIAASSLSLFVCTMSRSEVRDDRPEAGWDSRQEEGEADANAILAEPSVVLPSILAGTNDGLFSIDPAGNRHALWTGGSVKKIVYIPGENEAWVIMGNEGIFVSADTQNWEARNNGLPVKTIKVFNNGVKSFMTVVQEIKDVEVNPADPRIMVCA